MGLRVEPAFEPDQFGRLGQEWNALLAASAADTVFLTWEWISTWWAIYGAGSRLYVLAVRDDDGALVGIAPLRIRKRARLGGLVRLRVLEFIGTGGDVTPEYLDLIARPGFEAAVADAVADALNRDRSIDAIDLRSCPSGSSTLARLNARLAEQGRGLLQLRHDSTCPTLPLPATWDAYWASRSKNHRKKLKEYARRGERELGVRVRLTASPAEIEPDMHTLATLHHRRWDNGSRAFQSTRYREFHLRLARLLMGREELRLFKLEAGDKVVAALYCFAYHGRYSYYQAGRDPEYAKYRVGLLLLHYAIAQAIAERAHTFDFLSGDEDYKYTWAREEAVNVRLSLWKSMPARLIGSLSAVASRVRSRQAGPRARARSERPDEAA
jgi:CelD/BcsL family acetyltransferase involved in cellulose biosynthesis